MFKNKSTLGLLDKIADANPELWKLLADFGLVFGYGLLSYFIIDGKKENPKRFFIVYALSMIILILASVFIAPYVFTLAGTVISNLDVSLASAQVREATSALPYFAIFAILTLLVGGIALSAVVSVVTYAAFIISKIAISASTGVASNAAPGASFLLPGINLPFVEGILALGLLLIVHEAAHGVLSRVAKIKVDSAGVALFGFLPMGAFVEPDEKQLAKKSRIEQLRVMVAGSTSNFLTSILFFAILVCFAFLVVGARSDALYVQSGPLAKGTYIFSMNGMAPLQLIGLSFTPNETVHLSTSLGEKDLVAGADGHVGLMSSYVPASDFALTPIFAPQYSYLAFIFRFLVLVFVLNFLVGTVNLLPLPMFDGQRIVEIVFNDSRIVLGIAVIVGIAFLSNFLPWILK
ncbi:MAG TPA: site-2 protease family protein, partial [Candidatus Micrarchaeota archaeon]|nr:site-2 protease family protein [Candidatus Micrarchaeota archaeon]